MWSKFDSKTVIFAKLSEYSIFRNSSFRRCYVEQVWNGWSCLLDWTAWCSGLWADVILEVSGGGYIWAGRPSEAGAFPDVNRTEVKSRRLIKEGPPAVACELGQELFATSESELKHWLLVPALLCQLSGWSHLFGSPGFKALKLDCELYSRPA